MNEMNDKLIGSLVHGWPDKKYLGIILKYDPSQSSYVIYWLNWEYGDIAYWGAAHGGPSDIKKNILVYAE